MEKSGLLDSLGTLKKGDFSACGLKGATVFYDSFADEN